jgi:hypothetical protein
VMPNGARNARLTGSDSISLPWQFIAEQVRRNTAASRHFNTLMGNLGNVWLQQCHDWMTLCLEHQRSVMAKGSSLSLTI